MYSRLAVDDALEDEILFQAYGQDHVLARERSWACWTESQAPALVVVDQKLQQSVKRGPKRKFDVEYSPPWV